MTITGIELKKKWIVHNCPKLTNKTLLYIIWLYYHYRAHVAPFREWNMVLRDWQLLLWMWAACQQYYRTWLILDKNENTELVTAINLPDLRHSTQSFPTPTTTHVHMHMSTFILPLLYNEEKPSNWAPEPETQIISHMRVLTLYLLSQLDARWIWIYNIYGIAIHGSL